MKRFFTVIAIILAAVSCTTEQPDIEISLQVPITLKASIDSQDSKATLDGVKVLWSEGDAIAVYDGENYSLFSLVSGAGTKEAVFEGSVSANAGSFTAVYPFSAADLVDGELVASVPVIQSALTGNVDPNALVMKAVAGKGETLLFKNEASLLKFSVPEGVTEMIVAPGGHPFVNMVIPSSGGSFYVALTPGEYDGLTIFCSKASNWYVKSSDKPLVAARNTIRDIGELPLEKKGLPISSSYQLKSFLESSAADTDLTAILLKDIDMQDADMLGGTYTPAADFAGSFDGRGFTVSNISVPLFAQSHGSIGNLVLEGACNSGALECAPLVVRNYGTISGVTNKASVSVNTTEDVEDAIVLGGIAAYSYGTITNCTNEGAVTYSGSAALKAAALGGIAGYSEAAISECSNSGAVSLSAKYGSGTAALGKIDASACNLGGIIGAAFTAAPVDACTNSGAISFNHSAIDNATVAYERNQIGGIAGSPYGDITNCQNHGAIDVKATTSSRAAFTTLTYIAEVGGISGGSFTQELNYKSPNDNTSIIDCINDGDISLAIDGTKSYSPAGGIVGWPNGETTALKNKYLRCTNSGNITMSGSGKVRLGGIMGGTGNIESCTNSGTITVESANNNTAIGGIAGFHSQDHILNHCTNTGDVISKVNIAYAGGILGGHGNVALASYEGCKVDCKVENASDDRAGLGIIIGRFSGSAKNITVGTEAEPVEVAGTLVYGGKELIVDEKTFTTLLCGTDYASDLHVFHAICNVPYSGSSYMAEGYVKYDDGTPAAGVSVSDGFNVCVTDASGYYSLLTSTDTWYIYISLPSDAVISKNGNGSPDFFIKYKYPETRYDFTLTRQAVEDEFMIFALADPQAHYAKRSGQTISDTNRFLGEAVPAINSQISEQSLPCYGITLGDIVYSEGGRNSNNGMVTMRNNFRNVDMPVFQTMGNHDYTYFYSSNALSTDATSSTLFLKAQRKFEDVFGPINLSFNRGDVHFVCMRDIIYSSTTDASDYYGGFSDQQYQWLVQDLANVPKSKMVVLCVHIPICGITGNDNVKNVLSLMAQYASATVFSGHTHYKRSYSNLSSTGIFEHIHAAVCGQWWWSNVEGDGNPNGYTVYKFSGTSIVDEYSVGMNNHMNTRDYQMRIYRGNITNGGSYAYFKWPFEANRLLINVFNGDNRWKVKVYENGTLSGNASLMSNSKKTYSSVTAGQTYTVPTSSNQDWWAIGYHIGVRGRGTSSTSYYTNMFHMFTYTLKDANSSVRVEATDPYGNTYVCEDVVSTDCWYPDYMKMGNVN